MYLDYFGLKTEPFSISPDPRFLFMSEQHREALAHLLYGMKSDGGFVLLTGEVGTGKTTICRCLLEQLPEQSEVALLLNPKLTAAELLATICDELQIGYPAGTSSIKVLVDAINAFLLDAYSRGHHTVVIIDEAQNLQAEVLEQIRLLTNLETNTCKLLQIIMLGQPELKQMLNRPELRQLAQRITARYHLAPLSQAEVGDYVAHRISVAGVQRPIFTPSALRKLYRLSQGVPRVINVLCSRALLGAYVQGEHTVRPGLLAAAAGEILGAAPKARSPRNILGFAGWLLLALALVGAGAALGTNFFKKASLDDPVAIASLPLAEPAPDPFEWVKALSFANSESLAYQSLFGEWGINYPSDASVDPADLAAEHGLAQMSQHGNFSRLRELNRPVLLKLTGVEGEDFYAVLTALDGEMATLRVGTEQRTVAILDLVRQWFGEFTLLWQPPPGYEVVIAPGERGPVVQWLARQMDVLHGRPPLADAELGYQGLLFQEVQAFQADEGLVADGLVGPLTLIHLNNRTGSGQPRLTDRQKE
ncbi:MAG: peptidoglycan-binding protein [Desulfuromonadaceae bacterium GWC2_58_13]|nr:MAG: peptidoglycan-binding protein [Desulfuromonadaceae bacterium GWC2_58_13]